MPTGGGPERHQDRPQPRQRDSRPKALIEIPTFLKGGGTSAEVVNYGLTWSFDGHDVSGVSLLCPFCREPLTIEPDWQTFSYMPDRQYTRVSCPKCRFEGSLPDGPGEARNNLIRAAYSWHRDRNEL
jgi:hypothetical protein